MKRILKKISAFLQKNTDSFARHNKQYEAVGKFERDRDAGYKNISQDRINWSDFRVRTVLEQHTDVVLAVDIGSGTGWAAASLSPLVQQVIGIEPSLAAIDISKRAYPTTQYPNIEWRQGFAEELLPTLKLDAPTIFITGCVLSHLRDQEVEKICAAVCAVAPAGSVFAFSECWSEVEPWHQHMWHIRTKAWWEAQFPGWQLEFGGPKHEQGDYRMGIWGVKK